VVPSVTTFGTWGFTAGAVPHLLARGDRAGPDHGWGCTTPGAPRRSSGSGRPLIRSHVRLPLLGLSQTHLLEYVQAHSVPVDVTVIGTPGSMHADVVSAVTVRTDRSAGWLLRVLFSVDTYAPCPLSSAD
jgi:hypothetical protein